MWKSEEIKLEFDLTRMFLQYILPPFLFYLVFSSFFMLKFWKLLGWLNLDDWKYGWRQVMAKKGPKPH